MARSGDRLFSFGGCVYRMSVDGRHAASLAMLGFLCGRKSAEEGRRSPMLAGVEYMHTSNLPQGRAMWLRQQMSAEPQLTWAVSCDGDTSFDAEHLYHAMSRVEGQVALGIAPVRIGGTTDLCNINITRKDEDTSAQLVEGTAPEHGRRAFMSELQAVLEGDGMIRSGGFGLVVFNLAWFRACWKMPAPERVSIDTGEDIEFCRSVRDRGGQIIALKVRTDHFAFGEKQTR